MQKSEDRIQQEIVQWFRNTYCLKHHNPRCVIFSVPNGGTRNKAEAITLKATGLLAGVSDLILVIPQTTIYIEVKTDEGSQSPKQIEFEETIDNLGLDYLVMRSLEEFQDFIIPIMEIR